MMFNFKKKFSDSAYDMLIVGLGNPESKYDGTRHNIGFAALDSLCEKHGIALNKTKYNAQIGEATLCGKRVLLIKPLTYMNNSGEAVGKIASFYKIEPENVLIIFDDITLDVGKIRLRRKGSAGGHNGIKSIIAHLSSENFPRIKIGVGNKPHPDYDLVDWVLGKFPKSDEANLKEALAASTNAIEEILARGIESAMNKYSK